jgi:hypothetical protein
MRHRYTSYKRGGRIRFHMLVFSPHPLRIGEGSLCLMASIRFTCKHTLTFFSKSQLFKIIFYTCVKFITVKVVFAIRCIKLTLWNRIYNRAKGGLQTLSFRWKIASEISEFLSRIDMVSLPRRRLVFGYCENFIFCTLVIHTHTHTHTHTAAFLNILSVALYIFGSAPFTDVLVIWVVFMWFYQDVVWLYCGF